MTDQHSNELTKQQPAFKLEFFDHTPTVIKTIRRELCDRGTFQTRTQFDEEALNDLAADLRQVGINHTPIMVRPKLGGRYEIIAGERRVRAAGKADIQTLLALVGDFSDQQAAFLTITENLQRENLNPIEEAEGFKRLQLEFELTQKQMAETVSKSRVYVTNSLRLLTLKLGVRDEIIAGRLEAGHGKVIAGLDPNLQVDMARRAARNNWSVRVVEEKVRKINAPKAPPPPLNEDWDMKGLEEEISETLGHPFRIRHNPKTGSGKFEISYANAIDFEAALDRIRDNLKIDKF